jgi:hypothetical protein
MYRCIAAALAALLLLSTAAQAQGQRAFPANALRGSLVIGESPEILLNAKPARLGAGVRIRDQANLQPRPATLIGAKLLVHYTIDTQGLVQNVWILTPEEAARKPWPTTPQEAQSWQFDPVAQTWTQP